MESEQITLCPMCGGDMEAYPDDNDGDVIWFECEECGHEFVTR